MCVSAHFVFCVGSYMPNWGRSCDIMDLNISKRHEGRDANHWEKLGRFALCTVYGHIHQHNTSPGASEYMPNLKL